MVHFTAGEGQKLTLAEMGDYINAAIVRHNELTEIHSQLSFDRPATDDAKMAITGQKLKSLQHASEWLQSLKVRIDQLVKEIHDLQHKESVRTAQANDPKYAEDFQDNVRQMNLKPHRPVVVSHAQKLKQVKGWELLKLKWRGIVKW